MDMTSKPEATWEYQDAFKGKHIQVAEDWLENTHKIFISDTVAHGTDVFISSSGLRVIRNNIS
jgi:hypothetical protein